jgi:hypothetical protein
MRSLACDRRPGHHCRRRAQAGCDPGLCRSWAVPAALTRGGRSCPCRCASWRRCLPGAQGTGPVMAGRRGSSSRRPRERRGPGRPGNFPISVRRRRKLTPGSIPTACQRFSPCSPYSPSPVSAHARRGARAVRRLIGLGRSMRPIHQGGSTWMCIRIRRSVAGELWKRLTWGNVALSASWGRRAR